MARHRENGGHQGVTRTRLCALEEISEPGSRGFRIGSGDDTFAFFIVRHGGRVVAYENVCPHVGSPLDFMPDRFLDIDKKLILCATHGALFRIADGHCVGGPCAGQALTPVPIQIEAGAIYLAGDGPTAAD
jgi:nitrite reductase/ring-hydroxylating ferredoxin subunit